MSLKTNSVSSGYSTGVINSNFKKIEEYVNDNLLNRGGITPGEPNQMEVDLDMNSQDILNVGRVDTKEIGLAGIPIKELLDNTVERATQEANRAEGALDSKVDKVAGKQLSDENFTSALKDKLDSLSPDPGTEVNVQNGTAYTLELADAFKMITMDNASSNTVTVPPNSSVAFPTNTRIDLGQDGAGQTTVVAGAGVTIRTPETLNLRKQWSKASLIRRAADVWDVVGDLEAAT